MQNVYSTYTCYTLNICVICTSSREGVLTRVSFMTGTTAHCHGYCILSNHNNQSLYSLSTTTILHLLVHNPGYAVQAQTLGSKKLAH